jgi:hypothetical protein
VAQDQLRIYTIKPGEMDAWVDEWSRLVAPLRREAGFEILGAWTVPAQNQFVWIIRYTGTKTWQEANTDYYNSPKRKEIQPDPARHISGQDTFLMSPLTNPSPQGAER